MAQSSSVFQVLLSYRPLPLREPELYARGGGETALSGLGGWATWDVLDLETGEEVAQLSLRLDVIAPHLDTAKTYRQ